MMSGETSVPIISVKEPAPIVPVKKTVIVSEKDKPFILALCGTAMTILFGILTAINIHYIDPAMAQKVFDSTLPLTATAWGYYFAKKNGNGNGS